MRKPLKYTKCKVTGNKIPILFSFGKMPIANNFIKKISKKNYEMKIAFNEKNGVFQLVEAPKPEELFNDSYAFLSSTSSYMNEHFKKVATHIKNKIMKKKSKIMEIGCNDGIFLNNFKTFDHLGVEPSKNVYRISKMKSLNVENCFFDKKFIKKKKLTNKLDVIFAANVICHIPDILKLFKNIENTLKDDAIFIFEEPYLGSMLEKTSYDQIYDEHFYMFSANSIKSIVNDLKLELVHAERIPTHGGSMRYYVKKTNSRIISNNLKKIYEYEKKIRITKRKTIIKFVKNCLKSKNRILKILKKIKKSNLKTYGYGATSKSTTILHFCNIDNNYIAGIFDNSPTKINKYLPGKNIKIIDYKKFSEIKPKVCFLFAWNHAVEIFQKERKKNIKWISHINKIHFPKNIRKNFL